MKTEQVRGFAPKVRAVVKQRIDSLRLVGMLETAPATTWTKDGKLRISKRHGTFKRANRFSAQYGLK